MGAETPARRRRTAKELAETLGCHPRTIRKLIAEPREEFIARAQQRRKKAAELRATGMPYQQIADEMGIAIGSAATLVHWARKYGEMPDPLPPAKTSSEENASTNASSTPESHLGETAVT